MDDQGLCGLVRLGRETRDLDYKRASNWDTTDKAACWAIVKDILALAKHRGRAIVVGVDEGPTGFVPTGLTPNQLETWESLKISNFVQNYADPPVNLEVAKPECEGRRFAVLLVPQFRQVPHLCVKDFPGVLAKPTFYVRTANNSSEPVGIAQDLQDFVERAVRTHRDQMLESMREILTGSANPRRPTELQQFENQIEAVRATFGEPLPSGGHDGYLEAEMFPAE